MSVRSIRTVKMTGQTHEHILYSKSHVIK